MLRRRLDRERLQIGRRASSGRRAVHSGLNGLAHILALVFSVGLLVVGRVSIGTAAALFAAIERFQGETTANLVNLIVGGVRRLALLAGLLRVHGWSTARPGREGRRLPGQVREGIRLENVSFTYPGGDRPALANLDLTSPARRAGGAGG